MEQAQVWRPMTYFMPLAFARAHAESVRFLCICRGAPPLHVQLEHALGQPVAPICEENVSPGGGDDSGADMSPAAAGNLTRLLAADLELWEYGCASASRRPTEECSSGTCAQIDSNGHVSHSAVASSPAESGGRGQQTVTERCVADACFAAVQASRAQPGRHAPSPGALDAAYEVAQLRFKERSATMATSTTLPAVPGRPAIHAVRIPKASSSFLSLLARTLAGCSPEGYPCCRYPGSPAGSCPRRDLDCPLVKGCTDHFPQFADELASNDVEAGPIITVLRRPAERLLSAFFYVPPHRPPDANFSWAAFVAYANERRYQNTMTRMLGAGAHAYADVPAASSLEAARRRLAQLSWIGLSAAPAASTLLLYETEPFRALVPSRAAFLLGIEDAARAALRGHSRPATFTGRGAGDVESVVNSTNAADVSLYASALALFCGRLRATGLLQVPLVHEEAVAAGCDVAPPEPPADARAAPNVSSATAQGAAAAASVEGCDWARHSCAGLPLPAPRAADEADAVADRSPPHSTHDQRARTIWMFWAQGWARAPPLARACAASWGRLNPSWELRLLSTANLSAFSAEPSEAHGYAFRPPEESAHFSDLVRVELLRRHGGLWADASLLPIKPIESWLPRLLPEQGFWAVRGGATQTVSSWLLYAPRPGALVLEMLTAALRQFWRVPRPDPGAGNTGHPCYFSWHLLLRCLVGTYAGVALELERMPRLQAGEAVPSAFAPPRSDANRLGDTLVDERLKEFIRQGPFFKLSIRQEAATMGEDSLLAHFVALGLSGEEAGGCVV